MFEDVHNVPLAAKRDKTFKSGSFTLGTGDTLFVHTDGVPEANNTEGRMMGKERMLEALNRVPDADPETIINNVKSAVGDFAEGAPQFDDTTMLCLRYLGPDESRAS
jgi:sigma-B regulation protein RsbU (phosphoserine phosphatase)